jgi:aryl-alcohol dehydrogenase-like predicted oxidoreductase
MEKRELGKSGLEATVIGLGCWAMGGAFWGPADDEASIRAIQKSLDLGVNFIDTAPFYGIGHSEEIVGRAIKGRREEALLATKCGLTWTEEGRVGRFDSSRKRIFQEIDDSLRRLGVECIDLYQIHQPDTDTPFEESAAAMLELQQQGKIRSIGVSNYSAAQMEETMKHCRLDSLQPPYNMFRREIEEEILPFCRRNNIGVVSYGPMYQGLLTGKFFFGGKKPTDPLRSRHHELQGGKFTVNRDTLLKLKEIADGRGRSLGELAINWVICQPGITTAICGARNPEQVEENVATADWRLSTEELDRMEEILAERNRRLAEMQ